MLRLTYPAPFFFTAHFTACRWLPDYLGVFVSLPHKHALYRGKDSVSEVLAVSVGPRKCRYSLDIWRGMKTGAGKSQSQATSSWGTAFINEVLWEHRFSNCFAHILWLPLHHGAKLNDYHRNLAAHKTWSCYYFPSDRELTGPVTSKLKDEYLRTRSFFKQAPGIEFSCYLGELCV